MDDLMDDLPNADRSSRQPKLTPFQKITQAMASFFTILVEFACVIFVIWLIALMVKGIF